MTEGTKRRRRQLKSFSLRTGMLLVTIFGVWLGFHWRNVRQQQATLEAARHYQVDVWYDYQTHDIDRPFDGAAKSPVPAWLFTRFGVDHFHDVTGIGVGLWEQAEGSTANNIVLRPKGDSRSANVVAHLAGFPQLEVLHIQSARATDHDLWEISRLPKLRHLHIQSAIFVTDEGVKHLAGLKHLQTITLRGSEITDDSLPVFAWLPSLERLRLPGAHINGEGLKVIGNMSQLQRLEIGQDDGWATDEDLANLSRLTALETLDLSGTRFTEEGLRHLSHLKDLRNLVVDHSVVDATWLAEQLPTCRIVVKNSAIGVPKEAVWEGGKLVKGKAPVRAGHVEQVP